MENSILIFLYLIIHVTYVLRAESDMKQRFAGIYSETEHFLDNIYIGSILVRSYRAMSMLTTLLYPDIWIFNIALF